MCLRWSVGTAENTAGHLSFLDSMRDMHMGKCTAVDSESKYVGSKPPSRNGFDNGKAHPGVKELSPPKLHVTEGFNDIG
jgi:hypothetical protein